MTFRSFVPSEVLDSEYLFHALRYLRPVAEQLASLVGPPVTSVPLPYGKRMRGGTEGTSQVGLDREAFRLGLWFLDLRVALERGNRDAASETLRRLIQLFKGMDLPPPKAIDAYSHLRDKVQGTVPLPTLIAEAADAEKQASAELQEDPRLVELGRWIEACRLAGASRRADLFRERGSLQVLDRALARPGKDEDTLNPLVVPEVRAIRDEIAAGIFSPTGLGKRCENLLQKLDYD